VRVVARDKLAPTVIAALGVELGLGVSRNLWPVAIEEIMRAAMVTAAARRGGWGAASTTGDCWTASRAGGVEPRGEEEGRSHRRGLHDEARWALGRAKRGH
jgi:hypothetical protein